MLTDHKENWTKALNRWWSDSEKANTPVFRVTSPLSLGTLKSRGGGNLSIHFCADGGKRLELFFAQLFSVNQFSMYRAISDLCDEYKACQARTERPVLAGQSDPLFEPTSLLMKTPTPSTEVPAQEDLLQKHQERVEKVSQQNHVIKICIAAGFLTTVDGGQYFMTKDTGKILTIYRNNGMSWVHFVKRWKISDPKGWIRANHQKLHPCWKSQPATYKVNME